MTTDRRPYLNSGLSCIYVGPYFITKLLSVDGGLPYSPLDRSTSSASNTLQQYLEIIYSPPKVVEILDASGACIASGIAGLRCCIFTLDGFSAEDTEDPSRLDIEEGIRMAGGYISDCMVEGLTSYLLCRKMEGEKYAAAKSWGPKTIQVVHWTWLLKCLLTWSVVEPRDEESLTKHISNDIEIKVDDINPDPSNPMHAPYVACEDESVPLSQLSFNFYASQTSQASFTGKFLARL